MKGQGSGLTIKPGWGIMYCLGCRRFVGKEINILGIETSCDETAATVVGDGVNVKWNPKNDRIMFVLRYIPNNENKYKLFRLFRQ